MKAASPPRSQSLTRASAANAVELREPRCACRGDHNADYDQPRRALPCDQGDEARDGDQKVTRSADSADPHGVVQRSAEKSDDSCIGSAQRGGVAPRRSSSMTRRISSFVGGGAGSPVWDHRNFDFARGAMLLSPEPMLIGGG